MVRAHQLRQPHWRISLGIAVGFSLSAACAPPPEDRSCPLDAPSPPFRLTVDALDGGPLDPDLTIQVVYGGNQTETYTTGQAPATPDLCCTTVASADHTPARIACEGQPPDAAVTPNAIVCDLWTGGAANLTILVRDRVYAMVTLQAMPKAGAPNRCGLFDTIDAHWTEGAADAGVAISE